MSILVGVDIGGTNTVCGLTDLEGKLIIKRKISTEAHRGSADTIKRIADVIEELLSENNQHRSTVIAAGMGTPGFVDPAQGISRFAANLGWRNVPLAQMLSELIQVPVFVQNDVKMYIYGEAMAGAGRGFDYVFGVTIGTGIASASVHNGIIYEGGDSLAGEFGHIRMEGIQDVCTCGMTGCLETVVSATGMANQARRAVEMRRGHTLLNEVRDINRITAADVSAACDAGDEVAKQIMQYTSEMLAKGLSYAVPLLSPDVIVIGGGVAQAGERLLAPVRVSLKELVHPMYGERVQVKPAQLTDDAGVIGSALYAKAKVNVNDRQ